MGKRICLATFEFAPLTVNAGIGTYYEELAKLLSGNGWDVTVLYYPNDGRDIGKSAETYYDMHRIPIYNVNELVDESGQSVSEFFRNAHWNQARSHLFHNALQVLMGKYGNFDLVEFPDWGGTSFIPLQMRKNLGAYENTKMIVKLHGPDAFGKESNAVGLSSSEDLKEWYLERYSFENADVQVSPTQYMLRWCGERGWRVRSSATVCRNPLHSMHFAPERERGLAEKNEIIFFGRYERRKGVNEFIEALRYIKAAYPTFPDQYRATFIGKRGDLPEADISQRLDGYQVKFSTLPSRDQVFSYLASNARLVVVPSRMDNYPNTVLECMLGKLPFVTSRSGGIPEMLGVGSDLYETISCDVCNPRNLAVLFHDYLSRSQDRVQRLIDLAYDRGRQITDPQAILHWYKERLREPKTPIPVSSPRSKEPASVTVIVPTLNMSKYLETALGALANQTYEDTKVIIKDSSTDPKEILEIDRVAKKHDVVVIRKADTDLGNALNQALPYVDTKYVIEVDADNIVRPNMVETFVRCIENRRDVVALSCYSATFEDEDEERVLAALKGDCGRGFVPRSHSWAYYKPIGPCLPLLFFQNTQGDANSICLTEAVRSVGGWPEGGWPDWGLWLRLIAAGYDTDVIPEVLFYYRDRPGSGVKTKSVFDGDRPSISIIQQIIERRPEFFSRHYPSLHQLVRYFETQDELNRVRQTALYALDIRIAKLAARSRTLRGFLEWTGRRLRSVLH